MNNNPAPPSPNLFQKVGSAIAGVFRFTVSAIVAVGIIYAFIITENDEVSVGSSEPVYETAVAYEYALDESTLTDFINTYSYNYELALYYKDFSYIAE